MNFLAHIYLSGDNNDLMVGNFLGDFVKGKQYEQFPEEVKRGILLHRAIDEYTDQHPIVLQSKDRIRKKYRHYSGVIIDVFYDHFLAHNWKDYHATPLKQFTQKTYDVLNSYRNTLPRDARFMLTYMKRDDWLLNYAYVEGINRALTSMSRRTKFNSQMEEATQDLKLHYDAFKSDFQAFFPEVMAFAKSWG